MIQKPVMRSVYTQFGQDNKMRAREFITEQKLNEIDRIPASQYIGGKNYLFTNNKNDQLPLPGGSGLTYAIHKNQAWGQMYVKIFQPGKPVPEPKMGPTETFAMYKTRIAKWKEQVKAGETESELIGQLVIEPTGPFPIENAMQVDTINIHEDYRGMGLAKALYGIVLTIMKIPLLAGSSQTPGGRKNWVSLSQIPGVEMKGYFAIQDIALEVYNHNDPEEIANVDKYIDVIMGKLGGEYLGPYSDKHYFTFDVTPNTTANELQAYVQTKLSKVYDGHAGLYAIWTGQ